MATKEELKAKTDELGLDVRRQDGKAGEPTVADYQHALDIAAGAVEPDPPSATEKTFTVTGPFPVLGHEPGDVFTATVDADGVVHGEGSRIADEALLIAQGAITLTEEEVTDG